MIIPESSREEPSQNITQPTALREANLLQLFSNSKWSNKTRRRNPLKHHSEDSDNESNSANHARNSSSSSRSPWYPVERWGHQTFVIEKYMYLIGGYIENDYPTAAKEQLYRLNCETFEWERISSVPAMDGTTTATSIPAHRDSHMLCVIQDAAYMFGGKKDDEVMLDDLWKMTVSSTHSQKGGSSAAAVTWTQIEATGNVPLTRESAQLCSVKNRHILLFGGTNGKDEDENFVVYDDMHAMDTHTNEWKEILDRKGAKIAARDSFGMVEVDGYVYIFGGQGSSVGSEDVFYNDLYRVQLDVNADGSYTADIEELFPNVSDLIAASAKRPCGRSSNSTCVVKDRYIFVIGGEKGEEVKLDDVWVYDTHEHIWVMLQQQQQQQQQKKSRHQYLKPLISHSSSVYQDNIIVFGGMYKEENQCSDQTLVLSLNMQQADQAQQETTRKSLNSIASIQSEDYQHMANKQSKVSEASFKSGIIEGDDNNNNLHKNQVQQEIVEQLSSDKEGNVAQIDQENINGQQQQIQIQENDLIEKTSRNNDEDAHDNQEGEQEAEENIEGIEVEENDEDQQNRVIAVGTAGNDGAHIEEREREGEAIGIERVEDDHQAQQAIQKQQPSLEVEQSVGEQLQIPSPQEQHDRMEIEDTAGIKEVVEKPSSSEEDKIEEQLDRSGGSNTNNNSNAEGRQSKKEAAGTALNNHPSNKSPPTSSSNLNNSTTSNNNNINPVATTVTILHHQQQQHQQHHHIPPAIPEEHILHIRQPYVSMSFLSSIGSLLPSPITAFGLLAHNARSQFATTFEINLLWTPKKDTYMNTFVMNKTSEKSVQANNSSNTQAAIANHPNGSSKVNGQLLNKPIDKELIESSHLFFQIFDDGEGFIPQDFIDILYKFDFYQAIDYSAQHKELIQDDQALQAKTQYGNNLKLAGLRIGQNVLIISKNKAYNILNVGLLSADGKINPNLSECIIFLFSIDLNKKVYLTENGDQNKRIILNNIAFLMTEEQLFAHDHGTYIYIFDLKRVPQAGIDAYEFQYAASKRDIVEKKRCFFGAKKDQVERLIDFSLRSSLQHLYAKPPANFHVAINTTRCKCIAYKDVLRKQKDMRILRELPTENVELLRDLGKVKIYEVAVNENSSGGSSSSEAQAEGVGIAIDVSASSSLTQAGGKSEKDEKDMVVEQQIPSINEPKAEGSTIAHKTTTSAVAATAELFHQGLLIYAEDRLIGRVESHQFGNVFVEKLLNKTKGQQSLFKYVGIIELEKYFTPNIFNTGIQNSYEDSQIRIRIKAFLKQHQKQQQQQLSLQALTTNTLSSKSSDPVNSNSINSESKDRNDKPRTQSFEGSADEPDLRKEIKID